MPEDSTDLPPILTAKDYDAPSVFAPDALLREARRQKGLAVAGVPDVCLLDPDGDIVRQLKRSGRARRSAAWACYHTELFEFDLEGCGAVGVVGCAVGAPFAVLVAEQLFASGCRLLISITSAGQIAPVRQPPYFILIDRALRDEGASYHYLPPSRFAHAPDGHLLAKVEAALLGAPEIAALRGASWTTDAPFRETEAAIERARELGALAVEMEAAALYAFATAKRAAIVCFAHVTNAMGRTEGDFEKGEADGVTASLRVATAAVQGWRAAVSLDFGGT